jgi:cytochrome c-type protein NapB
MKKFYVYGLALLLSLSIANMALAQEDVQSLRGANAIDAFSHEPILQRQKPDRDPIERDYVQQPPLIPHTVEGYKVNLRFNKCLTCHSWANYRKANATKISQTHFEDRHGDVLANISSRRYFCLQCHVSQTDADVLVKNTFKPVQLLQK